MNPFLQKTSDALESAKISADLVAETYPPQAPNDAVLTFRAAPLLLRFTRRDSLEYLELACALAPEQFIWFGDVEVAMGWSSLEKILTGTDLPPLQDVVNRLAQHLADLKKLFFKNLEHFTQTAIQRTMRNGVPHIKPSVRALSAIAIRPDSSFSAINVRPL